MSAHASQAPASRRPALERLELERLALENARLREMVGRCGAILPGCAITPGMI